MGRLWRLGWTVVKVTAAALLFLELICFAVLTLSIYHIYGQFREGEPVRYDAHALYVNHRGVRPTAFNSPDKPGPHHTIWMFGGSTTRGIAADHDKTLPSLLAQQLNQGSPELPARVVNFGVDGFNSIMETKYLQKMLIESPAPPQLIIFYDGANDCAYFAQYRSPQAHHGYRQVRGLVESYHQSFFGLFKSLNVAWYTSSVRELWDKMRQGIIPISPADPDLREFVEITGRRYDYVNTVARGFGAHFVLFWQPCWWVETEPVAAAVQKKAQETIILGDRWALRQNFVTIYNALEASLREKPYFVDFRNILCSRQEQVYESDGIHLNLAGDRLVAARMSRWLKNAGILAAAPPPP